MLTLPSLIFLTRDRTGLIRRAGAVLDTRLTLRRYVDLNGCDKDLLAIARRLSEELTALRGRITVDPDNCSSKFTPIGELAGLMSTADDLLVVAS